MPEEQRLFSLRDYVSVVSRRRWYVVGAIIAALLVAIFFSYSRTPQYRASAQLTYQKQADISSSILGTSPYISTVDVQRELDTAASLMGTEEIARRAQEVLQQTYTGAVPADLAKHISATSLTDTNILRLDAVSTNPNLATAIANAYADGFVAMRKEQAVNQLKMAQRVIKDKMKRYEENNDTANPAYAVYRSRLQDMQLLQTLATGNYLLVARATTPTGPFSPNHPRDLALGLIVGLVAGVALAFLAEQLDIRVHSHEEMAAALGLPVLGRIPPLIKGRKTSELRRADLLVAATEPDGMNAEAFRMLRSNLDFVNVDGDVRSMLITSCTAAEGKTSTTCNLAVTLARAGKRIVVVEADLRRPKANAYFSLPNDVGLSDVVAGRVTLSEALKTVPLSGMEADADRRRAPGGTVVEPTGLRVLTSGSLPPNPGEIATSRRMTEIIEELEDQADLVLVDSPPFFAVGDAGALARAVDGVLVVMMIERVTKGMLREAAAFLAHLPCRRLGIVATNFTADTGQGYRYKYYRREESPDRSASGTAPGVGVLAE